MSDPTLPSDQNPAGHPLADWDALARYLAGESDAAEASRIEALLAENPDDRALVDALDGAISQRAGSVAMDVDVEAALARVNARRGGGVTDIRDRRHVRQDRMATPRWRVPFPAVAAAVALFAAGLTWVTLRDSQPRQIAMGEPRMLATGVGVRDSLELPDGSMVRLGPLSSVTIRNGFGEEGREVIVRGDAQFDVVHDEERPFTVRAGSAVIVDVGTVFAVRSDAADGVTVSVTEGSVSLRSASAEGTRGVILNAGDRGLLREDGQTIARRGAVTDDDVAWIRGRLVFRETPMEEVIASVRRWYGIEMRVESSLMSRHITATFEAEPADRVLEVLRLVLGAEIERRGDTVVVSSGQRRTP
jgi:transmembrane sensor